MSDPAAGTGGGLLWPGNEIRAALAAIALVVLGDILFWTHSPGISLLIFFAAIAGAVLVVRGTRPLTRPVLAGLAVAILGALPLIETVSFSGILSATFGVGVLALTTGALQPAHLVDLPGVLTRFGMLAPFRLARDGIALSVQVAERGLGHALLRGVLMWVVPLILALVFLGLFTAANPLIDAALESIKIDSVLDLLDPRRIILWFMIAAFAWPFLLPRLARFSAMAQVQGPNLPKAESLLFGRGAILRALILFNGLFAVQTVLDLAYLWGGVQLPAGMTYADYAHRGAYPLLITALLAAGFVLAAMRPYGAAEQSPLIRNLVYLFIAQNVMLVVSSILRLDLYVEVYSLTELRLAAGIWMGLVAIGLVLILARIALRKSSKWLVGMNLAALGLVLYACAYIDFAAVVAHYNVHHDDLSNPEAVPLDLPYILSLGPTTIPALDAYLDLAEQKRANNSWIVEVRLARNEFAQGFMDRPRSWGRWTLRDWRLEQYLTGRVAENGPTDDKEPYLR